MTSGERAAINDGKRSFSACPERMVAGGVRPRNDGKWVSLSICAARCLFHSCQWKKLAHFPTFTRLKRLKDYRKVE